MIGARSELNEITGEIVDAAYKLHTALGPGLLESVYELIMLRDPKRRGLRAARQVSISFEYDGLKFPDACRIDLLVEDRIVVEIKSVERLATVHPKQLLTYLRLLQFTARSPPKLRRTDDQGRHPPRRKQPPFSSAAPRLCVNPLFSPGL